MKYQIYCVRDGKLELDGCWGSENASFRSQRKAEKAAKHLSTQYPDVPWAVADNKMSVVFQVDPRKDFKLQYEGTISLLHPITDAASEWVTEHIPDAQMLGIAIAIEHRYVDDILRGIENDGLSVEVV